MISTTPVSSSSRPPLISTTRAAAGPFASGQVTLHPAVVTSSGLVVRRAGKTIIAAGTDPALLALLDRPYVPELEREQQSEFHVLETPLGPRRYPRVSSIASLFQGKWLSDWAKKVDRESWLTTAAANLRSTMLGEQHDPINREAAVASLTRLPVVWESDRVRENAAVAGTRTHRAIENYLRGVEQAVAPDITPSFDAWLDWYRASGFRAVQIEQKVGCWVEGFAGSADVILESPDGARYCGDWKRAKSIEGIPYKAQLGAYTHGINVQNPGNPLAGGLLIKLPRTSRGSVEVIRFTAVELEEAFRAFAAALTIFRYTRSVLGEDGGDAPVGGAH